jgi:hypothetical protein
MQTSESIGNLAKALAAVQGSLQPAVKDADNPFFKTKYADLSSVWNSCRELLSKNGLAVIQGNSIGLDGTVIVETMLTHTSGEWVRSELALPLAKHDPQGVGSAVTYGRRYGLAAIIGVVADVDDDANHASGKTNAPNNVAKMPPVKLPAADAGNAALIDALRETCKALNDAGDEIKWSPIEITMFANNMFGDEKNFTGRSAEQLNTLGEELEARLSYITKQAAATTKAAKSGGAK